MWNTTHIRLLQLFGDGVNGRIVCNGGGIRPAHSHNAVHVLHPGLFRSAAGEDPRRVQSLAIA